MDADPAMGCGATTIPLGVRWGSIARRCASIFAVAAEWPGHADRLVIRGKIPPDFVSSGLLNSTVSVACTCRPEPSTPSIS